MKKRLVIAALLAAALTGCRAAEVESLPGELPVPGSELPEGGQAGKELSTPSGEESPVPALSMEPAGEDPLPGEETVPAETEEVVPTPEEGETEPGERPTDEQVLETYHTAREAYGWFAGYDDSGLMLDMNDSITLPAAVGGGEWTFFRVTRPGLESVEALRAYLKCLFSDEVVDGLLEPSNTLFADGPQGGLYSMGAGRGSDVNTGAITEMVIWPEGSDSLCTVHVTVELLWEDPEYPSGMRSYDFPYQKVGDKWVFTHFEAIM